jgi:tyrosyl-tRNA synthetase
LVQQGGAFVNDEKIASIDVRYDAEALRAGLKIRKGKKVYHKAILGG